MSKGFGSVQRAIIDFVEKHRYALRADIIKAIAKSKPITKYEKKNLRGTIKKLMNYGVLLKGDIKDLTNNEFVHKWVQKKPKSIILMVNKENKKFQEYQK